MKLGASLGTEGGYLRSVGETTRAAETLGFAGLWTSETKHDAFLQLAIAANETEKIELGTSVANAFSPSPMETAHTAWDLQDLSEGRFILGLGTQMWV
jgi:alkanesulfonate monooxygenase SsuD/methylene tetrahydromethanopterin reductase-like flavin-dependent oxidoreductase (luciferase family)